MKKIWNVLLLITVGILLCACQKKEPEESSEAMAETAWNVFTFSKTETGSKSIQNDYPVSNEEELAELLKSAGYELQIPSYIPEGYEFENASLSYYVTKEILERSEVEENETKDGEILYQYVLPEDVLKQVSGFKITYTDQDGNKLVIDAGYAENMELDTGNQDFQATEAEGYDLSRVGTFKESCLGEFFKEIQPVYEYTGDTERKMSCILLQISMPDAEDEQIVKIAESM